MTKYIDSKRHEARKVQNFNTLVAWLFRSPLRGLIGKRVVLVTFTTPTNGNSSTIPVSYLQDGDTLLVTDGGFWQKKLRDGMDVSVRWNGKRHYVRCEVIKETDKLIRLISTMAGANSALRRFVAPLLGPDRQPVPDKVAYACRRGFAIIRLHLDPQALP